jgi:hypothetical protein
MEPEMQNGEAPVEGAPEAPLTETPAEAPAEAAPASEESADESAGGNPEEPTEVTM